MKNFQEWCEIKILIEALKNKDYYDEILRVTRKLYYEKNIDAANSTLEEIIQALNDLKITPPSGVTMERFAAGIKMIDRGTTDENDFKPKPPKLKFKFGDLDL